MLLGLCNLTGAKRKCPSYLLCSVVSDRRLEHALSDAYDQATAWRWVAERLANKLELPRERLDHAVLEVQQLQTVPAPTNVRANGSARHWSRGPLWGWRSTDPIINITNNQPTYRSLMPPATGSTSGDRHRQRVRPSCSNRVCASVPKGYPRRQRGRASRRSASLLHLNQLISHESMRLTMHGVSGFPARRLD